MTHDPRGELIVAEPAQTYTRRPPLVADCSVIACVLFDEPDRETALAVLSGRELFAPDLIDHEFVSVAVKKSRGGLEDLVNQALNDLPRLALTRLSVDPKAQWRLALAQNLTACDAAYLCLAEELGAPLATFDSRLGDAARRHLGQR